MIDFNALFKTSYGLHIISSGDDKRRNGFISNTIFQVTAEPAQFAACVNKNNYICEFIEKFGSFDVSVLHQNTYSEIFGRFGNKSGRDFNKLEGITLKYGETGVPIIMNDSIVFIECKVVQKFDVGTHMIFIHELIQAEIIDDEKEDVKFSDLPDGWTCPICGTEKEDFIEI